MIENKLFWKKYRPNNLNEIILSDRIRLIAENGLTKNYIFTGIHGCGKSSLVEILIKDHAVKKINASLYTSIDILRDDVDSFCHTVAMFSDPNKFKIVYLDEFDRLSGAAKDALKGFIEYYDNVARFIATTNHINNLTGELISRFTVVDFTPKNSEELIHLKTEYAKKVSFIAEQENIKIDKEYIRKLVNSNFPDLRKIVMILQHIKETGDLDINTVLFDEKLRQGVYDNILNKIDSYKTLNFIVGNFPPEKIGDLIIILGRPFIEYLAKKDLNKYIIKFDDILEKVTVYGDMLKNTLDPIVLAASLLSELKKKI